VVFQRGRDGQNAEMETNKVLVRDFCKSALHLLRDGGECHIVHKTKAAFAHWNIAQLGCISVGNRVRAAACGCVMTW